MYQRHPEPALNAATAAAKWKHLKIKTTKGTTGRRFRIQLCRVARASQHQAHAAPARQAV
eukprot:7043004-Alexandrium_andersonii.AAC.1